MWLRVIGPTGTCLLNDGVELVLDQLKTENCMVDCMNVRGAGVI